MVRIGLPKGTSIGKSRKLIAEYLGRDIDGEVLSHVAEQSGVYFYLLKQRDIPKLVHDGILDVGITVTEWLIEKALPLHIVRQLDWCDTRVSLLSHNDQTIIDSKRPVTCVTEFPNIARQFFWSNNIHNFAIEHVSGSCEGFVPSIYDCTIDCVETGASATRHNLKEEKVILSSKTVMIAKESVLPHHIKQVIEGLAL